MKIYREWSEEEIEWLKANYGTLSDCKCRLKLRISYKRLWEKAEELGLEKKKKRKTEMSTTDLAKLPHRGKKRIHIDEGAEKYCQDCKFYISGGTCKKTGKDVGGLWQKKCFRGEA